MIRNFIILFILIIATILMACQEKEAVTFNENIAAIIYKYCTPCHRPEGIGPFPFTSYSETVEYAEMIKEVTLSGYMPPWNADPTYSHFIQEKKLSKSEIKLISQWVDQGAMEGDSCLIISSNDFFKPTKYQKPDTIVCIEAPYLIKGNNKDNYRTFVVPMVLKEEKYITAVGFVPGDPKLVHHAWVYLDTSGIFSQLDSLDEEFGFDSFQGMKGRIIGLIHGYMPGYSSIMIYPLGTGKKIYKTSYFLFNLHYAPTPVDKVDQSCLHIYFSKEKDLRQINSKVITENKIINPPLFIPANRIKHFHEKSKIQEDISLVSIYPHMHFRGKTFKAYAVTPSKEEIPLLRINNWDFNWQSAHTFPSLKKIPANSVIHVEAMFDNTKNNPFNPILPPQDARLGKSSTDEMLKFGFEFVFYQNGDEYIQCSQK